MRLNAPSWIRQCVQTQNTAARRPVPSQSQRMQTASVCRSSCPSAKSALRSNIEPCHALSQQQTKSTESQLYTDSHTDSILTLPKTAMPSVCCGLLDNGTDLVHLPAWLDNLCQDFQHAGFEINFSTRQQGSMMSAVIGNHWHSNVIVAGLLLK